METDLLPRQAVVLGSAIVYWTGVLVQARRVRKRTGRSANSRPRNTRERVLWLGWMLVIAIWVALPFLARHDASVAMVKLIPGWSQPTWLTLGVVLVVLGYVATLWCYAIMGDTWRMGINHQEKPGLITRGLYARIRHPIYALQLLMLCGVLLLLPTWLALANLALHLVCVSFKAADEEAFLETVHGVAYCEYLARTGRFIPRFKHER